MNWLTNVVRPKSATSCAARRRRICGSSAPIGQLVFYKDVESNQFVIPGSNTTRMGAVARLKSIFDNETWSTWRCLR
jgi:acetyl-CoA carboxylase carboxyl transferase subunit beta